MAIDFSKYPKGFERVWDYLRFGERGDYVYNDENNRHVERWTNYLDTCGFECSCFETDGVLQEFKGYLSGIEAVEWLYGIGDHVPDKGW